ncbi:MAG TPA: hypothetical protein VHY59_01355, partial [Chthoniobacterales bacterium]|nr:hypothetical protein [Chthoniobacterales bacterium]
MSRISQGSGPVTPAVMERIFGICCCWFKPQPMALSELAVSLEKFLPKILVKTPVVFAGCEHS